MKNIILLFALIAGFTGSGDAQTVVPQHYIDFHPNGAGNAPLGSMVVASDTSYKPSRAEQFLYPGSEFTGSPANGQITNIYLRSGYFASQGITVPCTIYHLKVSLGITTLSDFDTTGMMFISFTHVVTIDSVVLGNIGIWTRIPLQAGSFNFDPSKSLVLSLSLDSGYNYNQCSMLVSLITQQKYYQGGDIIDNVITQKDNAYIDFGFDLGSTGVDDIEDPKLAIYPNPVDDRLYLDKALGKTYTIIDIAGKVCATGILTREGINTTSLSKGLYLLKIQNHHLKFIKE